MTEEEARLDNHRLNLIKDTYINDITIDPLGVVVDIWFGLETPALLYIISDDTFLDCNDYKDVMKAERIELKFIEP